jgi:broad specificity phosphatase PhoE
MARLYLVRHGKAAAAWGDDADPGLDDTGRAQAEAMAASLAPLGPLPVIVSPLRRTRETAAPLERRWGVAAVIEPRVAEVPSPAHELATRSAWLQGVMAGRWPEQDAGLLRWRAEVIAALLGRTHDTVVVSHYVAINVAVGAAHDDDRVLVFRPENCSCTILDTTDGRLRLVQLGEEGATRVL